MNTQSIMPLQLNLPVKGKGTDRPFTSSPFCYNINQADCCATFMLNTKTFKTPKLHAGTPMPQHEFQLCTCGSVIKNQSLKIQQLISHEEGNKNRGWIPNSNWSTN